MLFLINKDRNCIILGKNEFVEVSKNWAGYISENNVFEPLK